MSSRYFVLVNGVALEQPNRLEANRVAEAVAKATPSTEVLVCPVESRFTASTQVQIQRPDYDVTVGYESEWAPMNKETP
jgi:hypothetical protein